MDDMSIQTIQNDFQPTMISQAGGNVAIEQSKAASEIFGAILSAKKFPRDSFSAFNRIMQECERYSLSECALYSFPRVGTTVSGPSIRLAEVMARQWGNIDCGTRELERKDGESVMQAYAWDLETNYRVTKNFTVEHIRDTKKGSHKLTDQRDIYEITANQGSRRLRACILAIIPGDVVDASVKKIKQTIAAGPKGVTREDRIRNMVVAFNSKFSVNSEMIEKRLGHSLDKITDDEIVDLQGVYNALKDNVGKRKDYFDIGDIQTDASKNLTEKLKAEKAA